jgi:hypothetical protein
VDAEGIAVTARAWLGTGVGITDRAGTQRQATYINALVVEEHLAASVPETAGTRNRRRDAWIWLAQDAGRLRPALELVAFVDRQNLAGMIRETAGAWRIRWKTGIGVTENPFLEPRTTTSLAIFKGE